MRRRRRATREGRIEAEDTIQFEEFQVNVLRQVGQ